MTKYLWILLAGVLLMATPGRAQSPLPPGTQLPDSPAQTQAQADAQDLDAAEGKMAQQDFTGARPLVEKYLARHAADARALFDMGYLEQAAGRDDLAAAEYGKAIAADPKQFESRLALGLLLAKQGKPDEAGKQLEQAVLLTPAPPNPGAQAQAFRALAQLDRTSDPAKAKDALLSALRLSPETPQDLLLTAQIAEASGDSETAETAYRRLLARSAPGAGQGDLPAQATSGLVHLLLEQRKYDEAEPLLKDALRHDPSDPTLHAQLATLLIAQGKNDEALPVLEKLGQLEPDNPAVGQMLADAYSQAGHPEKADPIYAAMAQAKPNDGEILAAQGRNLILETHYPQAQEVLERAVRLKPEDGEVWSGLAFASLQNKQYSTTLQALSMRAKYLPETPASYFLWATTYDNLHQSHQAVEYYRKFLASAGGKLPDQEWQAKQRLHILSKSR